MKKREFNKLIREISNKKTGLLDPVKISNLSDDMKTEMIYYIVRNHAPVIKNLIPSTFDISWIQSMGYLYETAGKYFTFLHTSEHHIS